MFPVSVKGVFAAPSGEIVLLMNERGEWELPGGRIETGETPPACLAREIDEELGLTVEVGAPIDSYLFEVIPGKHVFIVTYRCILLGPYAPVISHEHTQIGLFAPDALPDNLPSGYRHAILQCAGGQA
ncbi:MAG: NUDIX domain-containing protein [Pseudomonadota bacterium]